MLEGIGRYKHVDVDVPLLEVVMAGYRTQHKTADRDTVKAIKHVLNMYVEGVFQEEEDAEDLWELPMKNGAPHKNINIYPGLLVSVLTAFRERHDTPFGSHAGIVRFVLSLYLARLSKGKGERQRGC